jgi:hypothetical protein
MTSPLKAIRQNCLECNGTANEVKLCPCTSCPLWPFRFGKNPYSKRKLTEEQKEAARVRLAEARQKKKVD